MHTYFIQNLETFECSMIFGLTFVAQCAARTFVLESGFVMRKSMKTKKFFGNFFGVIGILVILWLIFSYFNVIFARPFLANWNIFKIFEGVFLK